ncbi:MAG: protein phosphatase 2C domain-containing protein [Desulfobulbaceae bacterium]|nr:protein phosphatase 2C domain-containing protein [Desulfobulbaceae bacterium]
MILRWLQRLLRSSTPLPSFGRTDTGRVRTNNEDSFAILADRNLYLVADGMGGHNAGEVASRVAIEALVSFFSKSALHSMRANNEQIHHFLVSGLRHANDQVMRMAAADESLRGMGCTLVAALIDGRTLHTCHVGDARCYLANDDSLAQITTDHTLMAQSEGNGNGRNDRPGRILTRHVVTRAIGFLFQEDPEYHASVLPAGGKVLLCSDGLWSMVDDARLLAILREAALPEEATDIMVREANEAGGKDNITAVVVYS